MTRIGRFLGSLTLAGVLVSPAAAQTLTADQAVKMALVHNSQVIGANAGLYDARSGLYRAYSGVLPSASASLTRGGSWTKNKPGTLSFGEASFFTPDEQERYSTSPTLQGNWDVLNLSALASLSSARSGLTSARWSREAARASVALVTRQQFYQVVQAAKLVGVATNALVLARDSEHRVRALFEVGSVSRNDVLQAQVQTAQSQLDSIAAVQSLLTQRDLLAKIIGTEASKMGEVDTVLTFTPRDYDEGTLLAEARAGRPDLKAAEAGLKSAKAAVMATRMQRLPFVTVGGSYTWNPVSTSKNTFVSRDTIISSRSESDYEKNASVAINLNIFDGLAMEANSASARASLLKAQDAYDVLLRNLEGEVHEATLTYEQAVASEQVAEAAVAAATESVKLTQQKYNVGSATILDLITAQVQLQRAESQLVSALASIRVAEAQIERVRGSKE